jgi:tellurite resistance protein TerC
LLPEALVDVPFWVWIATVAGFVAVVGFDFFLVSREPHEPSFRECTLWTFLYVSLALAFGLGVFVTAGGQFAGEFYAGWLTEYSLSVDNLFVFVIIMAAFRVPRKYQQEVLLVGIVLALVLRGIFIAIGANALARFDGLFYAFGAFLVWTAIGLLRHDESAEFTENRVLRWVKRALPTTDEYHGSRLTVRVNGRRLFTPMLIVMVAIGTTDLLFALDSIPAIFGLTQEAYLVFTANAFALMGLRQLYFLIGGLLDRLIYLSKGLAIILGFIGVKLVLEALHHDGVSWAVEVPIAVSLGFIIGTLAVTTLLSVLKSWRDGARIPVPEEAAMLTAEVNDPTRPTR